VCASRSRDEVLLLLVADLRQVDHPRRADEGASGAGDRPFDGRARHLCTRHCGNHESEDYNSGMREADDHGTSRGGFDTLESTYRQAIRRKITRSGEDNLSVPRVPASNAQMPYAEGPFPSKEVRRPRNRVNSTFHRARPRVRSSDDGGMPVPSLFAVIV